MKSPVYARTRADTDLNSFLLEGLLDDVSHRVKNSSRWLRQEDQKLKAILSYTMNSDLAWAIGDPFS